MERKLHSFNRQLLNFLKRLGILQDVPTTPPSPGTVLARGVCFLHDGADNPNAFLLYADGWVCDTGRCHKERTFGCNIHGLIRHLVYKVSGEVMGWQPAWAFAQKHLDLLKEHVAGRVRQASGGGRGHAVAWTRDDLLSSLEVPAPYYLKRGYRAETLRHFGVGTCIRPLPDGEKRLIGWSVVPVWNRHDLPPFGYTARNPRWDPEGKSPKWFNGVHPSECLFNFYGATGNQIIICEGPGCVMRFHEAGFPGGVATLGLLLSPTQYGCILALLDRSRKVYIAGDTDEPGREFAERARHKLRGVCDPAIIYPPKGKDFGDASTEEVRAWMQGFVASHPVR